MFPTRDNRRTGPPGWERWRAGARRLRRVAIRAWELVERHELMTRAAAVAFYAFAAMVPFLALVLTISAQLLPDLAGLSNDQLGVRAMTVDQLRATVESLFPPEAARVVETEIARLQQRPAVPILSAGLVLTIWLSSSLFLAVIDGMNRIQGVRETRPFWRLYAAATGLAIVQSMVMVAALTAIVLWPRVPGWLGLNTPTTVLATIVQWFVVAAMIALSFAIALHFAPNERRCWAWITPGSLLGTAALLAASLGFRYYVEHWGGYSVTYGSLGGVVVLLAWMWVCAFVLFAAAVVNNVIAQVRDPCRVEGGPEPGPEADVLAR